MEDNNQTNKLALSVREALALVPIGRTAMYEAIRRGEIPSRRIGGRVLVNRAALERMFADGTSSATNPSERPAA